MLFTDAGFFLFLAVVFAGYYLPRTNGAWQIGWLLAASLFFYAYNEPWLLSLLLISAAITIFTSQQVMSAKSLAAKRGWAGLGVAANMSLLAFFKYAGFLYLAAFRREDGIGHFLLAIPLPIGISFYTFHGVSLLIDLLRMGPGIVRPQQDGNNAIYGVRSLLYLTFFPQLIAGPIVKAREFFPQIHRHDFRDINWPAACQALLIGYFLKSVIADNLQEQTFWLEYPYFTGLSALNLLVLLFGYSIQIFADFAGYSLIAIGLARLFGYELPENFRFPYIAETFSEFWTRWHISLSTWLREYLYIPLGGNRKGRGRTYLNLMTVMLLGGLWHGAAWSYAAWGTWHGMALMLERLASGAAFYQSGAAIVRAIRMALVFSVVTAGWLLFKLPDFSQVLQFVATLKTNLHIRPTLGGPMMILLYCSPVVAYHIHYLRQRACPVSLHGLRPAVFGLMLVMIALNSGPGAAFIYFQF
ncbi:MAG TPA: MBOAT family O-acyltransferase [Rhizomicrobium sp.]|nr:MBOAT family O-acyltransferase [Rhizomicrobium sp.]